MIYPGKKEAVLRVEIGVELLSKIRFCFVFFLVTINPHLRQTQKCIWINFKSLIFPRLHNNFQEGHK